jgi:tetratricopeptide (TPR) repeat protein
MRKLLPWGSLLLALLLGSMDCRAQDASVESSGPLILPANTNVILHLTKSLYKRDAKPGRPVEFEVAFDVFVNGQIFISSGTPVTGSFRGMERAGKGPPQVLIDLGPAQTVSGETVRLAPTRTAKSDDGLDPTFAFEFPPMIPVFVAMEVFEKRVLLDKDAGRSWLGCWGCGVWVVARVAENVVLDSAKQKSVQAQFRESEPHKRLLESGIFFEDDFKAQLLRQAGDLDAAINVYQQALAAMPDSLDSRDSVPASFAALLHLGLAKLLLEKRDFAHAIAEYRTAVQLPPKDEHAREGFVTFLVESDAPDVALAEIKEAMALWPDNIYFHFILGRLLIKKNDPDAAIVELQWALKKWNNRSSQANCELGRAFELKGDPRAALSQYRTAFRAHLNDEQCRANYERLRRQLKK